MGVFSSESSQVQTIIRFAIQQLSTPELFDAKAKTILKFSKCRLLADQQYETIERTLESLETKVTVTPTSIHKVPLMAFLRVCSLEVRHTWCQKDLIFSLIALNLNQMESVSSLRRVCSIVAK